MTQIDFYILADNSRRDINQMVCQLCDKALAQELMVVVYTHSAAQAQQLDDLLWTCKADSFIAHKNLLNEQQDDASFSYPVLISSELTTEMSQKHPLLINLTTEIPPFFQQFERLAELVGKNDEEKESARNRYRTYRQKGHPLKKYDL